MPGHGLHGVGVAFDAEAVLGEYGLHIDCRPA
jgi:hypothetical protein